MADGRIVATVTGQLDRSNRRYARPNAGGRVSEGKHGRNAAPQRCCVFDAVMITMAS
jgi:hypothetical protein